MGKETCGDKIKKADIFSQEIEILFDSGKRKLQTHCGVVLGAIMILIIIAYGYFKAGVMLNYEDNTIQEPISEGYFGPDFEYGTEEGWHVAFGLTAYDSSSDPTPFDKSFGELGAFLKIWGEKDEDGNSVPTYFKPLATRPCETSDIDFDNTGDPSFRFFAPVPEMANDAKAFHHVLNCITDEPVIMGDYNSAAAKQLVLRFALCDDSEEDEANKYCRPREEILNWLNRKFLLVMENQKTFNKDLIEENKISKSSRLVWNVLSPQLRVDIYNYVV